MKYALWKRQGGYGARREGNKDTITRTRIRRKKGTKEERVEVDKWRPEETPEAEASERVSETFGEGNIF